MWQTSSPRIEPRLRINNGTFAADNETRRLHLPARRCLYSSIMEFGAKQMSADCIFCQIAARQAQGHYVYQDDRCTAFLDVNPFNPGHTLVVPNKHFAGLADLPPDVGAHLFRIAIRLSQAIADSNVRSEGFNIFLSDGECAGQEVPHIHLHVLPRFENDGLQIDLGRDPRRAAPADLTAVASAIAECVGRES
jgi:histidine triad (HIT) family protein